MDSDDDAPHPTVIQAPDDHTPAPEVLHVKQDEELIEINSIRMFSFDELPLANLTKCTQLVLRKNLLHDMVAFPEVLRRNLVELDLFDNKISVLSPFFSIASDAFPAGVTTCQFFSLRKLDLSYNQLRRIEGLDDLGATLEELYLVENRLKRVEGLSRLVNLKLLELGGNRIRDIGDALHGLTNLEQLWLGKNKIHALGSCFHGLRKLKRLSLQANRLTSIDAEAFPPNEHPELEELFLSENGLGTIDGIANLRSLLFLDMSMNPIATLGRPSLAASASADASTALATTVLTTANFPRLGEFWLTDGKVADWGELAILRQFSATMHTVYLERNPLEDDQRYRAKVFQELPFLHQIDSWPVVNREDPEKDRARRS